MEYMERYFILLCSLHFLATTQQWSHWLYSNLCPAWMLLGFFFFLWLVGIRVSDLVKKNVSFYFTFFLNDAHGFCRRYTLCSYWWHIAVYLIFSVNWCFLLLCSANAQIHTLPYLHKPSANKETKTSGTYGYKVSCNSLHLPVGCGASSTLTWGRD